MASSPSLGAAEVLKLNISCDGLAMPDTIRVLSVEVQQAVNKIGYARLVLEDGDMADADFPASDGPCFVPGAKIVIKAGYGSEDSTIFSGIVVKHGIRVSGANDARLCIECRHAAVALTVGRKNAHHLNMSDGAIIAKLLAGCAGVRADVASTATTYKELVQFYASDWDFLLARAEANGLLVICGDASVSVQPPQLDTPAALEVSYGVDLQAFDAEIDARSQLASVRSACWDPASQQVQVQDASPATLNAQGNLQAGKLAAVLGVPLLRLQTPVLLEASALTAWAKSRQLKAGLARVRGSLRFQGSALALAGTLISLKGVGARFSGQVFVGSVQHTIANGNWSTEAQFGMAPEWFGDRQGGAADAPAGLNGGVTGLQIGVVKKLDADPDGLSKIQLSMPLLQAEVDGVWARLASFYGSDQCGAFFVPEIGDEVVVGYFNNDPSHPVVLGGLYSSKRAAPYPLTADNYIKALVTKGKLKVEFDDEKKVLTIITPQKNQLVLSDEAKSITLHDQNGNKVVLDGAGIVLDSPFDIALKAKGKITLDAGANIESTAQADIKQGALNIAHEAKVGLVAKGAASAELSASGQVTVKGAMVMIN